MMTAYRSYKPVVGEVVWYRTGAFTASRVKVLAVNGAGATATALVLVIDQTIDQIATNGINRNCYPETGGLPVSTRSLWPLSPSQQREWDLIEAAYECGPLDGTDDENEEETP